MLEFEPTEWASNCRQFLIQTGKSEHWAIDRNGSPEGYPHVYRFDTFAAAVAWCEERAKQQGQGGGRGVSDYSKVVTDSINAAAKTIRQLRTDRDELRRALQGLLALYESPEDEIGGVERIMLSKVRKLLEARP